MSSLFVAPVGYSAAYAPANSTTFTSERKVNPHKDCIFIDPRTGELTTIKPGITPPEGEKKKGKGGLIALGATVAAAVLAFVFRGKIKNIPFVKNTVMPALQTAKTWLTTKWTALKGSKVVTTIVDAAKKGYTAVKDVAVKAWDAVKGIFKKAPATVTTP
jgi:hypothetical protein